MTSGAAGLLASQQHQAVRKGAPHERRKTRGFHVSQHFHSSRLSLLGRTEPHPPRASEKRGSSEPALQAQ